MEIRGKYPTVPGSFLCWSCERLCTSTAVLTDENLTFHAAKVSFQEEVPVVCVELVGL